MGGAVTGKDSKIEGKGVRELTQFVYSHMFNKAQ